MFTMSVFPGVFVIPRAAGCKIAAITEGENSHPLVKNQAGACK